MLFWPSGSPRSVLEETANALDLRYWPREPLRLDAVFCRQDHEVVGDFPFPIAVAVEHENNYQTFEQEIAKLLSVRCQL